MAVVLLVAGTVGLTDLLTAQPSFAAKTEGADGQLIAAARRGNAKPATKRFQIKIEREVVMADELMQKGKYADAADLYKQVATQHPDSVPALVGYGMALAKQFKLDAANEEFDKVLALDDKNAMAHSGKAMVMFNSLQSSSGTVLKNKDAILQKAEAEVKQGLQIDPGMPEAHFTLGMIYKDENRIDESVSEFDQATKLDPQYSEAFSGLGVAKLNQGDLPGAITAFKQAISLNTSNSTAHYGLGTAYVRQGQFDDAIKELNTSLYQYPNSAPAHLSLGQAYAGQGNSIGAVAEFQKSISIKPEQAQPYLGIADIREQRGDIELSIAEARSGLELMPNNADLRQRIADDSLRLEKLDDAIKEYRSVLDQNPGNAQAAKGLTRAYYLKANKEATGAFFVSNEYENAKTMIDQAVKMNPNDMELRLAQAKLRSMSGDKVDLSQIGTPTNDGERIAYAEALLAQNKFGEADQQLNQVLGNAQTPKQVFAVADLALMIKDLPNAEAAYKKAASMPNGAERAKRGLDMVSTAKDEARQKDTLASDLAKKKQFASAIDNYKTSIYDNPKVADSRYGLGQTLELLKPVTSSDLREAIIQYKAYISLSPSLPPKELEKLNKHLTQLDQKAFKLEQKEKQQGTKGR
jgi:tetratricopeptide (TPR) repeat protein